MVGLVSCSGIRQPFPNTVIVGNNGNVDAIVYSSNAGAVGQFAAEQMQSYLKRMTGVELPVLKEPVNADAKYIRFVISNDSLVKWDGYRLGVTENGVIASARHPRALLYAAYDLLERSGCSFVYPGEREQIVPQRSAVELNITDTIINPLIEHRGFALYGLDQSGQEGGRDFIDWMAKNKFNYVLISEDRPSDSDGPAHGSVWKEVSDELLPELQKRGFVIEMSEHCTPVFFPRSLFKDHPDWFALNKGERKLGPPPYSGQICYSNKDAIEYYGNELAKYAASHPEFNTIGTWPLDGGEYCECEPCKDPQTIFNAVVNIAGKINRVRPDITVEHLAYKVQTWQPPAGAKIPGNISVLWCRDAGESEELVKQWIAKTNPASGVYQFEYYLGDNYRSRSNVWLRPQYAVDMVSHARNVGYKGVISLALPIQNWWRVCFNGTFFSRACWNADVNVEEEIKNYCRIYFGSQWQQAYETFTVITDSLQAEPFKPSPDDLARNWLRVQANAPSLLDKIKQEKAEGRDSAVLRRWGRIELYVKGMLLHTKAYHTRKINDLRAFETLSQNNAGMPEVLMYPGYIKWRNEEDFLQ